MAEARLAARPAALPPQMLPTQSPCERDRSVAAALEADRPLRPTAVPADICLQLLQAAFQVGGGVGSLSGGLDGHEDSRRNSSSAPGVGGQHARWRWRHAGGGGVGGYEAAEMAAKTAVGDQHQQQGGMEGSRGRVHELWACAGGRPRGWVRLPCLKQQQRTPPPPTQAAVPDPGAWLAGRPRLACAAPPGLLSSPPLGRPGSAATGGGGRRG